MRNGLCTTLLVVVLVLGSAVARAQSSLATQLERQIAKLSDETQVGLLVVNVDTGRAVYSHQPDTLLKPASVMKLLTTAAALDYFQPDFTYETELLARGNELWIRGAGDPALGDHRVAARNGDEWHAVIDRWATALRAHGATSFAKLVIDDHVFDHDGHHPRWPQSDRTRWYGAPVGGLNFVTNCVEIYATVADDQPQVRLEPPLPPAFIDNDLRVGSKTRVRVGRDPKSDLFEISGTVTGSRKLGTVAARRPTVFAGYAIREMLRARGVAIADKVTRRHLPTADAQAFRIATHRTPLRDVVWRANTHSQNMFSEALLKSLAAYEPDGTRTGVPGSWASGSARLRTVLGKRGVDLRRAILIDGSGLSHHNRLTARQVVTLLQRMRAHPEFAVFRASLAEAGESGTLRRWKEPGVANRLFGKTGSLTGVRALAGYINRTDGQQLAFALFVNGPHPSDVRRQFARILAD